MAFRDHPAVIELCRAKGVDPSHLQLDPDAGEAGLDKLLAVFEDDEFVMSLEAILMDPDGTRAKRQLLRKSRPKKKNRK
jgi:hypothetical protein